MTAQELFLQSAAWGGASIEPITGDASARRYFRLHKDGQAAVLMDACRIRESLAPFTLIDRHLSQLGLSTPAILASDIENGFLLLEDFGDDTFSRLLERQFNPETLFTVATEVLISLHQHPGAIPEGLRPYHPEQMLADIELFLQWHPVSEAGQAEYQAVWQEVLPLAHQVPASLLLRDYHAANLMWLPGREGIRRAGLLDFQDAYQGPITYDLISLLEDARRDVPTSLKEKMIRHYLDRFPRLDRGRFDTSLAILAALRHTRVLAIFEKLDREGKNAYKKMHSPRVERLLKEALQHPTLAGVKRWFEHYAR